MLQWSDFFRSNWTAGKTGERTAMNLDLFPLGWVHLVASLALAKRRFVKPQLR